MSALKIVPMSGEYLDKLAETPVRWLWEPMIGPGLLTVVWGPPGVGKSTWATNFAYSLAAGEPAHGIPTEPAVVYYISEDQKRTIRFRRAGRNNPRVTFLPSLEYERGHCTYLIDAEGASTAVPHPPIAEVMGAFIAKHNDGPDAALPVMFVVDSITHFLGIEDESSPSAVTEALKPLRHVLEENGAAMLGIHHANRSGTFAGSVQWPGQTDVFLSLKNRTLTPEKWREDQPPTIKLSGVNDDSPIRLDLVEKARGIIASAPDEKWSQNKIADILKGTRQEALKAAKVALQTHLEAAV